jgi:hypothetical protein
MPSENYTRQARQLAHHLWLLGEPDGATDETLRPQSLLLSVSTPPLRTGSSSLNLAPLDGTRRPVR